jgi:hypothetical protein
LHNRPFLVGCLFIKFILFRPNNNNCYLLLISAIIIFIKYYYLQQNDWHFVKSENFANGTFILAMALLFIDLHIANEKKSIGTFIWSGTLSKHQISTLALLHLQWHNAKTSNFDIGTFASTMAHCQKHQIFNGMTPACNGTSKFGMAQPQGIKNWEWHFSKMGTIGLSLFKL